MTKLDSSLLPLDDEQWLDYPAIQWMLRHRKQLFYAAAALLLILVILYRLLANQEHKSAIEEVKAAQAVSSLSNPEKREAALSDLQALLTSRPDLQAKYDGVIGQALLDESEPKEALPFIERTFARVKGETAPDYIDYAKNSVLITSGNFADALKNAYALKDKILAAVKTGTTPSNEGTLYAFNLIRIALLEKELKNADAERRAWNDLQALGSDASPIKIQTQEFQRVMTHFDDEGATLKEFIPTTSY